MTKSRSGLTGAIIAWEPALRAGLFKAPARYRSPGSAGIPACGLPKQAGRDACGPRPATARGTDHLRGVFLGGTGEIEKALRSRQSNSTKRDSLSLILRRGKMLDQPGAGGVGNLSPARACTAAR